MTTTEVRIRPARTATRSDIDILLDQLRGIEAWTHGHRATDLLLDAAMSRETRIDLARRRDVVDRQRQSLIDWTARQLQESGQLLRCAGAPRAVIVHRHDWFKGKVTSAMQANGINVVADLENGADAVGVVVAEQPDLVLLEDKLPMLTGLEVTRAVHRYAPRTVVVAQVVDDWEIEPFLRAGATTAYSRRVPPADIAGELGTFLTA